MTALPVWLDPLHEAAEMRAADAWAIEEQGVPQEDLMERAALGLARVTAAIAREGPIRIVVGKGNNGGDGRVAARLLVEDGHEVEVIDGTEPFEPGALSGSGVVVDALLGTGFEGEPREPIASAIWAINRQDAPVVACDVPSGVNASTGEVEADAVRATATATFHGSKVGLYVEPGKGHAGSVQVVDIGIPRGAPEPRAAGLISERVLDLYPHREAMGDLLIAADAGMPAQELDALARQEDLRRRALHGLKRLYRRARAACQPTAASGLASVEAK